MDPGLWQIPELLIFTGKDWLKTLVEKTSVKSNEMVVDFISIRLSLINLGDKYEKNHTFSPDSTFNFLFAGIQCRVSNLWCKHEKLQDFCFISITGPMWKI